MRKILHLSDLHFGRVNFKIATSLLEIAKEIKPDLLVVSGDLTQRATHEQFRAAREFLDAFSAPKVIVPGNHDVPLYNPWKRFVRPFHRYHANISNDLEPTHVDDEIAVFGLNTAHALTFKDGKVSLLQILRMEGLMDPLPQKIIRIIVAHHPFELPEGHRGRIVNRASLFMSTLARHNIDLFLCGHLHRSYVGHSADRYETPDHSSLIIHAGTAISSRTRREPNSFNVISVEPPELTLENYAWQPDRNRFLLAKATGFVKTEKGWAKEAQPAA